MPDTSPVITFDEGVDEYGPWISCSTNFGYFESFKRWKSGDGRLADATAARDLWALRIREGLDKGVPPVDINAYATRPAAYDAGLIARSDDKDRVQ